MDYFTQPPPEPSNLFYQQSPLDLYLKRVLPGDSYSSVFDQLQSLGEVCAGELFPIQQETSEWEPELEDWDGWGNRIDRIRDGPLWAEARKVSLHYGVPGLPYSQPYGAHSRLVQASMIYLLQPVSGFFTCPLAMTDGAAGALLQAGNDELIERYLPRLTADEGGEFSLSGQWMTETTGGSDLSRTETEARKENETWKLYGKKWFVSAVTSDVAMVLARPEPNPDQLAVFFADLDADAVPGENMTIDRLKDKLGTRRLPTAEVTLSGLPVVPVDGLTGGIKTIGPMLNRARFWNSACAVGELAHALKLLEDYATRREVFGDDLANQPMFESLLKQLRAEQVSGLYFTLHLAEVFGESETDSIGPRDSRLIRLLTPLAKLSTARQAVHGVSEALEGFGGVGYMEDTGLARKLRDTQVFPIWEGATNVLVLEFLENLRSGEGWKRIKQDLQNIIGPLEHSSSQSELFDSIVQRIDSFEQWLAEASEDPRESQRNARDAVFKLVRAYHLGLLGRQAVWEQETQEAEATAGELAQVLNQPSSNFFPR